MRELARPSFVACFVEVKASKGAPPQVVKDVLAAVLIALGHPGVPEWREVVSFLQSLAAKALASMLRHFDPDGLTPTTLRRLAPRVLAWDLEHVTNACKAIRPFAMWVEALYAYGVQQARSPP